MKYDISVGFLCAALLVGCATPRSVVDTTADFGALTIQVPTLPGLQGDFHSLRIYVDGQFVGNYQPPEGTTLFLPVGRHTIRLEHPRAFLVERISREQERYTTYPLTGQVEIDVLGGENRQTLIFDEDYLTRKALDEMTVRQVLDPLPAPVSGGGP